MSLLLAFFRAMLRILPVGTVHRGLLKQTHSGIRYRFYLS
jgi:hypothetical protein